MPEKVGKKAKKKSLKRLKARIKKLEAETKRLKECADDNGKNIAEIKEHHAETNKKLEMLLDGIPGPSEPEPEKKL